MSKAAGPDDIQLLMVRWPADFLAEPLSKLLANSFSTDVVPTDWRLAIICPIYKKGGPEEVSNHHPVSRTSIICKIFERILKRALLSFHNEARAIPPHQHGFVPCQSSSSNLLVFEEVVTRIMDEGHTVDVIYPDFVKAFDPVNHRFLSAKKKSFGRELSGSIPMDSKH